MGKRKDSRAIENPMLMVHSIDKEELDELEGKDIVLKQAPVKKPATTK